MTQYDFSFSAADATRDQMAAITLRMQAMLQELDNNVKGSLQQWTSAARDQYNISQAKWNAAANEMPKCLNRAELALNEISNGYLRVEHTGVNMWSGTGL